MLFGKSRVNFLLGILLLLALSEPFAMASDSVNTKIRNDNDLLQPANLSSSVLNAKRSEYFDQVNSTDFPLIMIRQIEDDSNLSTAEKEFLLFTLAKNLKNGKNILSATQALISLAAKTPQITTQLNDGGHRLLIDAFPFNRAAEASLDELALRQQIERLTRVIREANFATLEAYPEQLLDAPAQIELVRRSTSNITRQQAQLFLDWSVGRKELKTESKFFVALKAENKSQALAFLQRQNKIPLHRYLPRLVSLWPQEEQLNTLESISHNKQNTSLTIYFVEQLHLPLADKVDFWLRKLRSSHAGNSAAHLLAKNMNDSLIATLESLVRNPQELFQQLSDTTDTKEDTTGDLKSNALMALALSRHPAAKAALVRLRDSNSRANSMLLEVSQW